MKLQLLPEVKRKTFLSFNSGAGNYFRPRAILGFYFCLAGQINVKKAL